MAFMHCGHVLAAVLAAILMLAGRALLMLGMVCKRICGSRCGRRLGGQRGRGNQRHHVNSPEFE
jgi:hypothetical protein